LNAQIGDAILVLRRAADVTQEELAERLGITQVALSRYENNLRTPDEEMLDKLAAELEVTSAFLTHDFRMRGAIAADAHMRRQKTAKATDWKRVEAQLNALRMHSAYLFDRVPMRAQNQLITVDPDVQGPATAAQVLRATWRMPIGAVRDLSAWIEAAGILIVEQDMGTARVDGMSQWAAEHPVILVNSILPTDRKRLTLAHELGHLVMHTTYGDADVEDQANAFAAEFLMPEQIILPQLRALSLGKLAALKAEWGVSMQAILERAARLGKVSSEDRTKFYRQLNARGWKMKEPGSDELPLERPHLAESLGRVLAGQGLHQVEINRLTGLSEDALVNPLLPEKPRLRAV
jgi:Zn-dependent peptidase ImmA (M78 family)